MEEPQRHQGRHDAPADDGGTVDGGGASVDPDEDLQKQALELVLKRESAGGTQQRVVLHIQDTGGQPVFLPVLDMLIASAGTVHMVVFSLPKLHKEFDRSCEDILHHLRSIFAIAPSAPLILVGTRRHELESAEGESAVRKIDNDLMQQVTQRCRPMLKGLVRNSEDLCIFAIENQLGLSGDASIQRLVGALDTAVKMLPTLKLTVPVQWLKVYDALRSYGIREGTQWMSLSTVHEIAESCGLPHEGLRLDQEVAEVLRLLHELNVVLWFGDEAGLEDLVVLDAQWLLQAATCIIRQYSLPDHSSKNSRMQEKDELANREVPDDWIALTRGRGILRPSVRKILWSDEKFKRHEGALLKLMVRFGLAIPLPGCDKEELQEHLIPSLLQDVSPVPWPQHGAVFRVHFSLKEHEVEEVLREVISEKELEEGFLPMGAFHRLLAGILGSTSSTGWETAAVDRLSIQVLFGSEPLLIRMLPRLSCIEVRLHGRGHEGVAAEVLDRFRVLLKEHLQQYDMLRQRLLAKLSTRDGDLWIDLDMLMGSANLEEDVIVGEQRLQRAAVKDSFAQWLTRDCEFFFIDAIKLRTQPLERLMTLQEMKEKHPSWVVPKRLNLEKACQLEYVPEYLAVSHRWEEPLQPDGSGEQLRALIRFLREPANERIRYVFYDSMSLPQGNMTQSEKRDWQRMLPNISIVYLASTVLILADLHYMTRFWTLYEAWTSFQRASREGLLCIRQAMAIAAPPASSSSASHVPTASAAASASSAADDTQQPQLRSAIVTLHSATEASIQADLLPWSSCTVQQAHDRLLQQDIVAAHPSDKQVQLEKLFSFNEQVKLAMQRADSSTPRRQRQPHDSHPISGYPGHSLLRSTSRLQPSMLEEEQPDKSTGDKEKDAAPPPSSSSSSPPRPPPDRDREGHSSPSADPSPTKSPTPTNSPSPAAKPPVEGGDASRPGSSGGVSSALEDQLQVLFARLRLAQDDGRTARTATWFSEKGLVDLPHLKDAEMEDDLIAFLALPEGPAKILKKHINEKYGQ